jgi:glutathione synthase
VKKTFTRMYPMNNSEYGRKGISMAFESPDKYVLKPQREGGGNNIYRSDIPGFLKSLPNVSHYNAYILMELIQPPPLSNSIIREGKVITGPVIGELGVYGTIVWHEDGRTIQNEMAGWLLRTKGKGVNEGGVAAGFGCVDSVCLYDD